MYFITTGAQLVARFLFLDVTATILYGGVQNAVWYLAKGLYDAGHDVSVFGGAGGAWQPDLEGRAIDVRTFPFTPRERFPDLGSRFQRLGEKLSFGIHARDAVIAGRFDWIIITKPFDFFWPLLVSRQSHNRFIFRSGGTDFFPGDRWLARYIDVWLTNSHFNAWQIKTRYKRYPHVIYNGVDPVRFAPQQRDTEWRRRHGVLETEVLFVFAGRLVGWKGVRHAVESLADSRLQQLPVKLLIVGDGPERLPLECLANALSVRDRVIFHPAVNHEELPILLASADIGIYPSVGDEGFSNSIAEAMCSGLPVITTAFSGNPETVGNEGTCGLLIPPGLSDSLVHAMVHLADHHELRARMGANARQRILTHFTWPLVVQRLLNSLPPTHVEDSPSCADS
jgi:glycosyltransferase involved in cell wall biosynthesis